MADTQNSEQPKPDLEDRKLALEESRAANEHRIALVRLALEARQVGRFSTGTVTLVGAAATMVGAVAVAMVTGTLEAGSLRSDRDAATLNAEADRKIQQDKLIEELKSAEVRLNRELDNRIILQATKDVPVEVAVENLRFFVEAGILPDPESKILALAKKGIVPTFPDSSRVLNPLLERASSLTAASGTAGFVVSDGLLVGGSDQSVTYLPSPALSPSNEPRYAVIHFTGVTGPATARWLTTAQSNASAHLLIGRDGAVTQLVPFDYGAWHAGRSAYGSVSGLNRYSIGIELENAGPVTGSAGTWRGQTSQPVADADVGIETGGTGTWQTYPPIQIDTLVSVLSALRLAYPEMVDLLGHSDISPGRKLDPGPLFPMSDVRQRVFGRPVPLPPPP